MKRKICPVCRGAGTMEYETKKPATDFGFERKRRVIICSRCKGRGEVCKES